MYRLLVLFALVCFSVAAAGAQSKIAGVCQFGKPDPQHMLPAGDRPDHSFGVDQLKCTWIKPHEIAGDKSKEGISAETLEVTGGTTRSHVTHVTTMDSGDKYFVSYQGTGTTKDGAYQTTKGTWAYAGGAGKLKGIKGKGAYNCSASGDGVSCDIQGEYQSTGEIAPGNQSCKPNVRKALRGACLVPHAFLPKRVVTLLHYSYLGSGPSKRFAVT